MSKSGASEETRGAGEARRMPRDVTTAVHAAAFSDSFGGVTLAPAPCPVCGGDIAVNGGGCLKCLLGTALDEDGGTDGADTLEAVLGEIDLPDTDWRLGNYHILEEIGRGGMGVIYRARQRHSKRVVALKRVLSYHGDSRETLERFRREAEAAASLDHPNILPIYEVGEADGLPFFTLKLATGGSLQGAAAGLSAQPRDCVRLLAKVARAIAYAHRQGILHRDLKPGNILLDARGEPLVSDFGLAKWMDANTDLTRSLAIFGTPGFIAPEQAAGPAAALTPSADIYSLGAILFDLLTGRPPFLGEHAISVIHQAAQTPAPKLRSINGSLDRDLETICAKCLEREPQTRYRSAADLAEDLERWLEGRPIVARPVSFPSRVWRWSRRNPIFAGAVAAVLALVTLTSTRQIHSWRLEKQLAANVAAQHSLRVVPLLDLDTAQPSQLWRDRIASGFRSELRAVGPASVTTGEQLVAPRHSSTSATDLAVNPARVLVTGTVRRAAGRTRVSIHLLNAETREALLQRRWEGADDQVGELLHGDFAREVYSLLSAGDLASVTPANPDPGLRDEEARRFIEAGTDLARRRGAADLERAVACLEQAIALQPRSAAAHAELARALGFQAAFNSSGDLNRALEAGRRAVALAPTDPEAHVALAAAHYHAGKIAPALDAALTALECSPSSHRAANILCNIYRAIGRPDKALAWLSIIRASERYVGESDPALADSLASIGETERAERVYATLAKLRPEQPEGWMGICRLRLLDGRLQEARAIYQQKWGGHSEFAYARQMAAQVEFFARDFEAAEKMYSELYAAEPTGGGAFYGATSYASVLGRIKLDSDVVAGRALLEESRRSEAEAVTSGVEHPSTIYRLAAVEASLGEVATALGHLQAAANAGWIDHRSLAMDPRFDAIRGSERFETIHKLMIDKVEELRRAANLTTHR